MQDLKAVFASNLIRLRNEAGLTQAELAEKIHYSDKSVSKWERAESLPDLQVTHEITTVFGVTVDFMLHPHDEWNVPPARISYRTEAITMVSVLGVWLLAVLAFVVLHWTLNQLVWVVLLAAVPLSLIVLLVLNSVFKKPRYHFTTVSLLVLSGFGLLYYLLSLYSGIADLWVLVFLWVLAELVVVCSFRIRKRNRR